MEENPMNYVSLIIGASLKEINFSYWQWDQHGADFIFKNQD